MLAMTVVTIRGNSCGAPLQAPPPARYLTCGFCGAQLQEQCSGTAYYTEVLQQLSSRTDRLAEDVAYLKLESELEQLDRDWEQQRQGYLVCNREGKCDVPSRIVAVLAMAFVTAFTLLWIAMGVATEVPAFFVFFGIAAIVYVAVWGLRSMPLADEYEDALAVYQQRRWELLERLKKNGTFLPWKFGKYGPDPLRGDLAHTAR